jgi:DNA-binding MarR family transcriptional regulator
MNGRSSTPPPLFTFLLTIVVITTILFLVKDNTQSGIKQRLVHPEETASIDLFRTADLLSRAPAQLLKSEDLSPTQYNVLRILRGAPSGLPCGEIAGRMITRDPDITRLLDRLAKRGLIARRRETKDRRVVLTRITSEGLELLARLDAPMQQTHRKQLGHLGRNRMTTLIQLLEAIRSGLA